ncbi:MAG TPA: HD domain-containing protein [Candidatus Woesebacteria bacterium]|nr:HD domain-containing protein [Candidatus Woesebacteria bacterium]
MNQELLNKLVGEYKQLFENVWEFGGGYGFRINHGIRVMDYCQKIVKYPRFKDTNLNTDAVIIAGLFHDVGKVKAIDNNGQLIYGNYGDTNHNDLGSKIASEYLNKYIKDKY